MVNFSYNAAFTEHGADIPGMARYYSQSHNPDIVSISPRSTPNKLSSKQGRA